MDYLSAAALMPHVRYLAEEIGPRPAGHVEELRAHPELGVDGREMEHLDVA